MDGGGSMQGHEERGAEKLMDSYLKSIGLHRKKIAKDGSCLFRAVAEQVLHCQSLHTKVRAKCVEFLRKNRESYEAFIEGDFEDYLFNLQDPQQWVGEVEINALAVMYKRDFLIYQEPGKPPVNITDNNFKDKVRLCFLNGNHYDSVYPINHIKDAALCQSILYELLYDGVFKVDRGCLGPCQRTGRPTDLLSDDSMNTCVSSDESDLDAGEALWVENGTSTTAVRNQSYRGRGRGRHLPERVRRSLNPTLLRNIEYDVWHKTKRAQQKMDYCIAAGMQFAVGDRCQVRLDGRSYSATVKEVPPNNGPVTVHIEELGSKKQVSLWSLRPLSDESSWSTVVNRDKRLSNGHGGEWEERGKGRGRGKHVPASSSSVTPATAPGSSGRVQKQHSWPPQATAEEQGGAKATRKSVSLVERAFGVTEEHLLAKEEEERNVALVEIQLRDEYSFPALGAGIQGDGGKKKGGEKRHKSNKTKSPVEDIRAPSPSAGERPKSSTPPPASTAAAAPTTAPTANTTTPTTPTLPAAKPPAAPSLTCDSSNPAWLSTIKAAAPNMNTAAAPAASTPSLPLTCAASAVKTSTPSYAAAPSSPPAPPAPPAPAAAPSTKPPVMGGAVPPSIPSSATLFSLVTPSLPAASSPPTPSAHSSSSPPPASSSSLPPKSSTSPPPPSLPPPTFIAPIAPSPSSLPRSSPPVSSLPHSPSPPSFSSSSSLVHQAAKVPEAPAVSAQSSLPNIGGPQAQIHPPVALPQNQSQISVPQTPTQPSSTPVENQTQPSPHQTTQVLTLDIQAEAPSCHPQSHAAVTSLPQTQIQPSVLQTSLPQASVSQPQLLPQSQSEVAQVQSSSYPCTSQVSLPASVQLSVTHPHPQVQLAQPPHPSQVPHPSLSLASTQNPTEASSPPVQHPQPHSESPAHAPTQLPHPPYPPHHPQLQPTPPLPHPPTIPGTVPLQQLSQLYQDLLYPGFPLGEKGDMAPTPSYSCSKSGDDLPKDVNILKFFFNLGVKAYSMPVFPPYLYLLPLQQAHAMHPKLPSRSPSPTPHYPPSNPPARHQEAYPHPQYPPTSASMPPQYDHQAPLAEPPHPTEPSFNQAGYPVTQPPPHRMPCSSLPWQQPPPPRNPSYPVGYPTANPPYRAPPPLSQGYHSGQGPGHLLYPQYPPTSLGYPPSSSPEELQVSQAPMEHHQAANVDTMPSQGLSRVPGSLESPAPVNMANANSNRPMVVPGYALKKEQVDSLTRAVLLVDPPLNNTPIITLVSNPDVKDVSMATMKPGSTPGSPSRYDIISKTTVSGDNNLTRGYRGHQKPLNPPNTYVPLGQPEPSQNDVCVVHQLHSDSEEKAPEHHKHGSEDGRLSSPLSGRTAKFPLFQKSPEYCKGIFTPWAVAISQTVQINQHRDKQIQKQLLPNCNNHI